MKAPSFQFYPGDHLRDPAIRGLSLAARGLWIDMLCLMHQSDRRGYLEFKGGGPIEPNRLAIMVGGEVNQLVKLLDEMRLTGVFSEDNGTIYSRRMVRDEELSQIRRESGKKGGNPRLKPGLVNQNPTTRLNQNPTPSSSSSSSSSIDNPPTPKGGVGGDPPELLVLMGGWFDRNADGGFSEQERAAFQELGEIERDDFDTLGDYYTAPPPTEGKDFRRQSLKALLKNFRDEVDKARSWKKRSAVAANSTEPEYQKW